MFSWSTFEVTIAAIRVALESAYSQVAMGKKIIHKPLHLSILKIISFQLLRHESHSKLRLNHLYLIDS